MILTRQFIVSPNSAIVENNFDRVTKLVTELCDVPYAALCVSVGDCNLVRSSITPKTLSADALADIREFSIKLQRFLVVTKTSSLKGPNKTSWPSELEFYAGAKLKRANGEIFGTLCIWDYTPQELSELQIESLKLCAQFAAQKIELTRLLSHPRNKCELLNTHNSGPATTNYRKNLGKLTPREKEIMYLILDHTGESSNKDIARHLGISHRTVELHRLRVFAKMHVRSAAELVGLVMNSET